MHRLKVRMMPFKNTDKHAKVFMEKFMDIVALVFMPLSYVTFKDLLCDRMRGLIVQFDLPFQIRPRLLNGIQKIEGFNEKRHWHV